MKKTNIALVGMLGIDKFHIARELGKRLDMRSVDIEEIIEYEYDNIFYLFDVLDEEGFMKYERKVVSQICSYDNIVISTGEGVLDSPQNVEKLKNSAVIVYLKDDVKNMFANVLYKIHPRIKMGDMNDFVRLFNKYKNGYVDNCEIEIDVRLKSAEEIVDEICDRLVEIYTK